MTDRKTLKIAGKTVLVATLMGGSSFVAAQDVAVPTTAPTAQTAISPTAQPTITPPPAVRTLPTANDTINPAAAQAAEAEATEKRTSQASAPVKPRVSTRTAAPVAATPPLAATESRVGESLDAVPSVDAIAPAAPVAETPDVASTTPEAAPVQIADDGGDDVALIGGLAAALAALGIVAAAMSRRRRKFADYAAPVEIPGQNFAAPRPIKDDPAFAPFAATSMTEATPSPAHNRNEISRAPVITRPDVPVTDPLFSRPVPSAPITDPLFAPRNDVQTPITDPLFANHDRFAGRVQPAPTRREAELVN